MRNKKRIWIGLSILATAIAASGVYFGFGAAHASGQRAAPFRPLAQAQVPAGLRDAVARAAGRIGVDPSAVSEAGAAGAGSPYRATLVAHDASHRVFVSFASSYSITSFTPVETALAGRPMLVLEGTAGTPSELTQVGISIVTSGRVARVEVGRADGSTAEVPLTPWAATPFSSASISATASSDFPTVVRAYDKSGRLLDQHTVDLTPIHL